MNFLLQLWEYWASEQWWERQVEVSLNEKQQHHKCSKETIMYLSSYRYIYILFKIWLHSVIATLLQIWCKFGYKFSANFDTILVQVLATKE
jgi:hypothetical protein